LLLVLLFFVWDISFILVQNCSFFSCLGSVFSHLQLFLLFKTAPFPLAYIRFFSLFWTLVTFTFQNSVSDLSFSVVSDLSFSVVWDLSFSLAWMRFLFPCIRSLVFLFFRTVPFSLIWDLSLFSRTAYKPQLKILKRPEKSPSEMRSEEEERRRLMAQNPVRTLAQREAAYAEARQRIMGDDATLKANDSAKHNDSRNDARYCRVLIAGLCERVKRWRSLWRARFRLETVLAWSLCGMFCVFPSFKVRSLCLEVIA